MTDKRDGGRWALAGYLYQIVGMLSITAHVSSTPASKGKGRDDINVMIDLDVSGSDSVLIETQHERLGEDALFQVDDKGVLVQFKYSSTTPPARITGPELEDIIAKLDDHAKEAQEHGREITSCVLVTNREFTSRGGAAESLWEHERVKRRTYKLRRLSDYSLNDGIKALRRFALEYGATNEEATRGVRVLVGRVLTQTCERTFEASTFEEDLVEAFTGSRSARRLTAESAAGISCRKLREFGEYIRTDQWAETPVSREAFEDVLRETRRHSLVGIYGPGGCGKSVLIWQLMRQLQSQGRHFFAVEFARNVQVSWVTNQVHRWRNLSIGKRPDDDLDSSLSRLVLANPGSPRPIIWLALDGLDEETQSPGQRDQVQQILRRFWDMDNRVETDGIPLATLVVTCRRENDLKTLLSLPYDHPRDPAMIPVDEFSQKEFEDAVRLAFELGEGDTYESYNRYLEVPGHFGSSSSLTAFLSSANEGVIRALKHPAMWRALLNLQADVRLQAIKGDRQAISQLASHFIKWFCAKLRLRVRAFQLSEEQLFLVLGAIAQHTIDRVPPMLKIDDWVHPARQTGLLTDVGAGKLYEEAELAGLVMPDAHYQWRWRHSLIFDHLIAGRNGTN